MKNLTFIIAEAGINHNGNMDLAYSLIDVAVEARVDAVKFQTFNTDEELSKDIGKANYQEKTTDINETLYDMTKKWELNDNDHDELILYCKKSGITFLSSASDNSSVDLLINKGQQVWKIPSNLITDYPYLIKIGKLKQTVIMSTGMASMKEINDALQLLLLMGMQKEEITVLHCNTEYPTPIEDVNLNAMLTIRDELGVKIGYSDHTLGIEVPIAAVAMGATVIEKHFTLDRTLPGPDHAASLEPDELKSMVTAIRNIENAMGSGIKKPSSSEIKNMPIARKSIVAKKSIKKSEKFSEDNLTVKRPGTGISPMEWDNVIAKVANHDYEMDDLIR